MAELHLSSIKALVLEKDPLVQRIWLKELKKLGLEVVFMAYAKQLEDSFSLPHSLFFWEQKFLPQISLEIWQKILQQPKKHLLVYENTPQALKGGLLRTEEEKENLFSQLPRSVFQQLKANVDFIFLPKTKTAWAQLAELLHEKFSAPTFPIQTLDPLMQILRPYLLFQSEKMHQSLFFLPRIAKSPYSVLIQGETGTGKDKVAHAIHALSNRAQENFVGLNCGAIPETLIESELFGFEKGAFTGAQSLYKGKFEQAHQGTLFLDEIGEMTLSMQVRLLKALEEGTITRIGGSGPIAASPRIIAATQVDLEQAIPRGLFRADLYYRLNVLFISLPPLRERVEDISLLANVFLERTFLDLSYPKPYPTFSKEAIKLLQSYYWPGNVRELKNMITRVATLVPFRLEVIEPKHLWVWFSKKKSNNRSFPVFDAPFASSFDPSNTSQVEVVSSASSAQSQEHQWQEQGKKELRIPYGTSMKDAKNQLIHMTLEENGGNYRQTAKNLGMSERHLRRILSEKKGPT